jgi:multidrug resistance efflux pump
MTEAPPSTASPSTLDRATIESGAATARRRPRLNPRAAITGVLSIAIIGLAIWYLARPEPLLVQGEAQSTRIDMAARVSGRLAKISVVRGQDVPAGATLLEIDNPLKPNSKFQAGKIQGARNAAPNSMAYDTIPCASGQGIYCGLAGN